MEPTGTLRGLPDVYAKKPNEFAKGVLYFFHIKTHSNHPGCQVQGSEKDIYLYSPKISI